MPTTIRGFTLVEVMIALVVMAIGLLGLAGMQAVALRSITSASYRGQATILASDMIERIRANRAVGADANPANVPWFNNFTSANVVCGAPPAPYCSDYWDGAAVVAGQPCTATQLATVDTDVIVCGTRLANGHAADGIRSLPGGVMTIACATAGCPVTPIQPRQYVVSISWQERGRNAAGNISALPRTLSVPFIP